MDTIQFKNVKWIASDEIELLHPYSLTRIKDGYKIVDLFSGETYFVLKHKDIFKKYKESYGIKDAQCLDSVDLYCSKIKTNERLSEAFKDFPNGRMGINYSEFVLKTKQAVNDAEVTKADLISFARAVKNSFKIEYNQDENE